MATPLTDALLSVRPTCFDPIETQIHEQTHTVEHSDKKHDCGKSRTGMSTFLFQGCIHTYSGAHDFSRVYFPPTLDDDLSHRLPVLLHNPLILR